MAEDCHETVVASASIANGQKENYAPPSLPTPVIQGGTLSRQPPSFQVFPTIQRRNPESATSTPLIARNSEPYGSHGSPRQVRIWDTYVPSVRVRKKRAARRSLAAELSQTPPRHGHGEKVRRIFEGSYRAAMFDVNHGDDGGGVISAGIVKEYYGEEEEEEEEEKRSHGRDSGLGSPSPFPEHGHMERLEGSAVQSSSGSSALTSESELERRLGVTGKSTSPIKRQITLTGDLNSCTIRENDIFADKDDDIDDDDDDEDPLDDLERAVAMHLSSCPRDLMEKEAEAQETPSRKAARRPVDRDTSSDSWTGDEKFFAPARGPSRSRFQVSATPVRTPRSVQFQNSPVLSMDGTRAKIAAKSVGHYASNPSLVDDGRSGDADDEGDGGV